MFGRVLRRRSLAEIAQWVFLRSLGLLSSKVRLLPDFIVIGTQRGGTTSLFNYITRHSEIYPSFPKEVHYYSNHYHKGIDWYRSHFPLARTKSWAARRHNRTIMTGEATPYYLSHPRAPQRASRDLPNLLMIILLRNPIDRAYSHYYHEVNMGVETLSFEEAISREEERLAVELVKLQTDENYQSFNLQHFSYLSRGVYIDQLERWDRFFDREQMLILKSEKFFEEPLQSLHEVMAFLGVTRQELAGFKPYNASRYPQMDPSTKDHLKDYFKPYNQRLYQYLEENLGWED